MTIEQAKSELEELNAKEKVLWDAGREAQRKVDELLKPWHEIRPRIAQLESFIKFNNGEQDAK